MGDIPADSLWAYRDGCGGLPVVLVYVEGVSERQSLMYSTFLGTAFSDHTYLDELRDLTAEKFWALEEAGGLERIDDPAVKINLPF